jgi:hypothetical protein
MRRIRQLAPALLVAIFWIAQVQATVHSIGHLNQAQGVSDRATAPHSVLCIECAAFAQAGAVPVAAPPAAAIAAAADSPAASPSVTSIAAAPAAAYRSRAPPSTPI